MSSITSRGCICQTLAKYFDKPFSCNKINKRARFYLIIENLLLETTNVNILAISS
uniref:Uncharacterized protein n=1 Tax=Nelumbo nucifera TaxID=4432 RepID=A0A822Y8T3_NELNU|nr:TPA_asm: hypothetical protein HUJ06_029167 [Nelumbo nucifera]